MNLSEEKTGNRAGCQGATCCPLASELKKCEERIKQVEYNIGRKCGKLSLLLMQAAALISESGLSELVAPPNENRLEKENVIRECIRQLMESHDGKGGFLMKRKCHWQAIYRIIVDKELGVANGDYEGFLQLAGMIEPVGCRIPFSVSALKQISKTNFTKPFAKWVYDPVYFKTRSPYDQMVAVATKFKEILEEHGL